MTLSIPKPASKVNILPKEIGSLARGLPPTQPGTLFVLGVDGGMSVAPDAGFDVVFGRNDLDSHVCVGRDDPAVSRRQGYITREHARWVLYNVGKPPIRMPGAPLLLGGHQAELPVAYVPLFIVGPKQEHLLEVRIATKPPPPHHTDLHEVDTRNPDREDDLSPTERLVLVCLSQRYLRQEPQPQPLTWDQVASELSRLQPDARWNSRRAARVVENVRLRFSNRRTRPVRGITEAEVPPPVGNTINHNLITHLLVTTTITKSHLRLLDVRVSPATGQPG